MSLRKFLLNDRNTSFNIYWLNALFIALAICGPWFNLTISSHDLVKSYFASFGIGILMLLSFFYKCNNSEVNLKINYIKLSFLLLFVLGICSVFWSVNFDFTINKLLLWLIAVFSFLLSLNLSITYENLIKIAWGLILSAGIIAVIGISQHLFDPFSLTQAAPPASTFGNKNMATQPLVLILPLIFFLLISKNIQDLKVWTLTLITSLVFVYIFYSVTRAVWVAIFIELLIIILYFISNKSNLHDWVDWNKNKRNACIFGILLTLFLINFSADGFTNFLSISTDKINSISESASSIDSPRYQIWETAINMVYNSPLIGTGLGTYSHNLANEGYATWNINNTFRTHNDLLELAVELGLTGIVIFIAVMISIMVSIFTILKNTSNELHFFYFLLFAALAGSFVNLQFSFPYQMSLPLLILGLYCGLIAKQIDYFSKPIKSLTFSLSLISKKFILLSLSVFIVLSFYFTYFSWIKAYNQLEKINILGEFNQIEVVETPVYHIGMQFILYSLGGQYFKKGHFKQSNAIDNQFLKFWPNHLDVIFRAAYAKHKLNQNTQALELVKKLKRLEPQGLYNSYILEMIIYLSNNEIGKFNQIFNELLSQPEEFLKLNDDTYRYLIFFTLASKDLSEHAPILYKKYSENHSYSCEVENNIAVHYFNLELFDNAAQHVMQAFEKGSSCLNPELIKLLEEKDLIVTKPN